MAKKAAAAPSAADIDKLVRDGLLKIAGSETPLRFSGKTDALFKTAAGTNKLAIERLKQAVEPLATENASGVKLTPAGFALIEKDLAPDRIGIVAKSVVDSLSPDEQVAFIPRFLQRVPTAAFELEPLLAEAVRRGAEGAQRRVQAEIDRAESSAANRIALRKCEEHLQNLEAARIEELKGLLIAAGGAIPAKPPIDPVDIVRDKTRDKGTESAGDRDLRRDFAERLVASWRSAVKYDKKDARDYLETMIENLEWMIRIGEEGETVPFDRADHADMPGLSTDAEVRIIRSGWAIEVDAHRQHVIEKALVAK